MLTISIYSSFDMYYEIILLKTGGGESITAKELHTVSFCTTQARICLPLLCIIRA